MALIDKLTAIANAIRGKTGGTEKLTLDQMAAQISGMESGGYMFEDMAKKDAITGDIVIDYKITRGYAFANLTGIGKVTLKNGYVDSYRTDVNNVFNSASVTEVYEDTTEDLAVGNYTLNPSMFMNCTGMKKAVFKKYIPFAGCFSGCTALEYVELGNGSIGGDNVFNNCKNLKTLVLRWPSVVNLSSAPTYWAFPFNGTPFDDNPAGTGGTVYVPAALIESYQSATNWSALYAAGTCSFAAIEGSEYE